jgi:hypothetical protein
LVLHRSLSLEIHHEKMVAVARVARRGRDVLRLPRPREIYIAAILRRSSAIDSATVGFAAALGAHATLAAGV